mgnify:CR=1 FL=1
MPDHRIFFESQGQGLAGTVDPSAYRDVVVVLATAGVIVPLAKSLKVNSVIAFVACGALLGPYGLGGLVSKVPLLSTVTVSNAAALAGPAELGVAFLLFVIGLELSFERLMTMKRLVFGLRLGQVVLSGQEADDDLGRARQLRHPPLPGLGGDPAPVRG